MKGRNALYYPKDASVVTADLSPEMLERAWRRIEALGRKPHIVVTDALNLQFKDHDFGVREHLSFLYFAG